MQDYLIWLLPVAVTAILYFLLRRRLGWFAIFLASTAASWGLAYLLVIREIPARSGFVGLAAAMILVAYVPICLAVALLCRFAAGRRST